MSDGRRYLLVAVASRRLSEVSGYLQLGLRPPRQPRRGWPGPRKLLDRKYCGDPCELMFVYCVYASVVIGEGKKVRALNIAPLSM